jgi:hypothetical protein
MVQADSIIPEQQQGTQAWDRFAYVNNNPLRYTDPSGNFAIVIPVVAAIILHPVFALAVAGLVITTAHNVLPGRDERNAAMASGIEQAVEMTKRTLSETEKKMIEMTSNSSGASDPTGPINVCKFLFGDDRIIELPLLFLMMNWMDASTRNSRQWWRVSNSCRSRIGLRVPAGLPSRNCLDSAAAKPAEISPPSGAWTKALVRAAPGIILARPVGWGIK